MASRLQDVLLQGLAAARPAATDVANGTLYYSTDTEIIEQSDGTVWSAYSSAPTVGGITQLTGNVTAGPGSGSQVATVTTAIRTQQIGITVDGGGVLLTTGIKGYKSFPVAGTLTGWRILADAAGDVDFDIFKDPFASYPPTTSILTPSLSGVDSDEATGLSTAVAAGDVFGFEITGTPLTITRATLELTIVVT